MAEEIKNTNGLTTPEAISLGGDGFRPSYLHIKGTRLQQIINKSSLRDGDGEKLDSFLKEIQNPERVGLNDLVSAGLTRTVAGGIGNYMLSYEKVGDMTDAEVTMHLSSDARDDTVLFDMDSVPLPIFRKKAYTDARVLAVYNNSHAGQELLEDLKIRFLSGKVLDLVDTTIFKGIPNFQYKGEKVYGYTTHPNRKTVKLADGGWAAKTGKAIVDEFTKMLQIAYKDLMKPSSWTVYVANNIWTNLQKDYSDNKGSNTIVQRMLAFSGVDRVVSSSRLKDNNVVMVHMSPDDVRLNVALDLTGSVRYNEEDHRLFSEMYASMVPVIYSDMGKNTGVIHESPAALDLA